MLIGRLGAPLLLLLASGCGKSSPAKPTHETNVLFIGDSLTAANNLPHLFASIAASQGDPVSVLAEIPSGAQSTSQRAMDSASFMQKKLPSKEWDFVVIQEHSELPALPEANLVVAPHLRRLTETVRAGTPNARLVYMATWGFKNGDPANCGYASALCSYDSMQEKLMESYTDMARENAAVLAPVGTAWREVRRARPDIELYSDDHHPSLSGTYLTACVVYSILFKKKSLGADPQGLDPAGAAVLQAAADAVAFDPASDWRRFERASPAPNAASR